LRKYAHDFLAGQSFTNGRRRNSDRPIRRPVPCRRSGANVPPASSQREVEGGRGRATGHSPRGTQRRRGRGRGARGGPRRRRRPTATCDTRAAPAPGAGRSQQRSEFTGGPRAGSLIGGSGTVRPAGHLRLTLADRRRVGGFAKKMKTISLRTVFETPPITPTRNHQTHPPWGVVAPK